MEILLFLCGTAIWVVISLYYFTTQVENPKRIDKWYDAIWVIPVFVIFYGVRIKNNNDELYQKIKNKIVMVVS